MKFSKQTEIQKQINFIFRKFNFNNIKKEISEAHKLLKAYEYNGDIKYFDIQDDITNKKIKIKIKDFNDEDMVFTVFDDGK